jgi:hypothetical protein
VAKKADTPTERYLAKATPQEQRDFANALLAGRARVASLEENDISRRAVLASRLLSLPIIGFYIASVGLGPQLIRVLAGLTLCIAMAWFPNQVARATGRIGGQTGISRPSHPRIALVVAWLLLLMPFWLYLIFLLFDAV